MKNYSMKPTEENAIDLLRTDPISRNNSVFNFVSLLYHIKESCIIAVNGEWGTGKTFFVKQVKLVLDALNASSDMGDAVRKSIQACVPEQFLNANKKDLFDKVRTQCVSTVYYDAWMHDEDDDPILSLVYATVTEHQSVFIQDKQRSVREIVAALAGVLTGRDFSALQNAENGEDFFASIKKADNIRTLVKQFFDTLIVEKGNRLVIFVDELDRCKPDYAIRFMERIKHYFDDDRITFVFSVNISQLQATAKCYYGADFNATRYLDKFFDLKMTISTPDTELFMMNRLGFCEESDSVKFIIDLARQYRLSLREMERFARLLKICVLPELKNLEKNPDEAALFSTSVIVPIIILLQMTDMQIYQDFVSGRNSKPLLDVLNIPTCFYVAEFFVDLDKEIYIGNHMADMYEKMDGFKISEILEAAYTAVFNSLPLGFSFNADSLPSIFSSDLEDLDTMLFNLDANSYESIKIIISMLSDLANYEYE